MCVCVGGGGGGGVKQKKDRGGGGGDYSMAAIISNILTKMGRLFEVGD